MRKITNELIQKFKEYLIDEEKSSSTLEKYIRDITVFMDWCKGTELCKSLVLEYKQDIIEKYAPASVNSILSSLNSFFVYNEWYDLKVKAVKIQRQIFASKDKELATTWDLGTNGWDSQRGSNCGQAISYFTNRLCDCGYSDEVSGLAQKAIGTADAKEKQELWNTIQDKALEECWEYPLTYTNFVMVSQKNVTGLDGSSVVPEFIDYLSIHVD